MIKIMKTMTQKLHCGTKHHIKQWTTHLGYALVALLICQSFLSMGKALDSHDVASLSHNVEHQHEHTHTEHTYLHQAETVASDKGDNTHNPADCHHCGHCHGSHVQWLSQSVTSDVIEFSQLHTFHYLSKVLNALPERLLRPPKV
ncbi:hypothetical protein KUL49_14060 [Alteromonas sp. KUL49]|nr:hypothetical protein KUL49_14060 [Alteromonas sp. KUL49]